LTKLDSWLLLILVRNQALQIGQ